MEHKDKLKIGIFGGSFNPPHLGHLLLARRAFELLNLNKIIFIPAFIPPHKKGTEIAAPKDRLKMLELSVSDIIEFVISSIEIDREGTSYTYDTLIELKNTFPKSDFYLLVGYDNLLDFHNWKNYLEICKLCTLAVLGRNTSHKIITSNNNTSKYCSKTGKLISNLSTKEYKKFKEHSNFQTGFPLIEKHVKFLNTPLLDISSTEIRKRIKSNLKISFFVTEKVEKYITKNGLYK